MYIALQLDSLKINGFYVISRYGAFTLSENENDNDKGSNK